MKRTKIVATIGPACAKEEILEQMVENGMNVARINFSHGTHESNGALIEIVKKIRNEKNLPIGIMADLQGPRIRVMVEKEVVVKKGEEIFVSDLSSDEKSSSKQKKRITLDKKEIINCIEIDNEILIEDGKIKLRVLEKKEGGLLAEVLVAGTIRNHKGVNIPDTKLNFGALTEKDEKDLAFALSTGVDFVALSFVGDKKDILNLKEKIKNIVGEKEIYPKIIAKIERKKAIENIDEIIATTDAIMVARGDLGIEMAETKVVIYQKEIIEKCLAANKPVIVATQMLESMIENPLPTRAEVSDVSNAVIDHADAVMLSGESANGKFPVEAVETMAQIIRDTEESRFDDNLKKFFDHNNLDEYHAVIDGAHELAKCAKAKAILMFSFWGNTPRMMSQHRPEQIMLCATTSEEVFFQTTLLWGVEGFLLNAKENPDNFLEFLTEKSKEKKILQSEDSAIVIMGRLPDGKKMRLIGIEKVA